MPKLLEPRTSYKPFEYPEAYEMWEKQERSYWLWTEAPMDSDVQDWNRNFSDKEKSIVGGILKGFAQTECMVNNYWLIASQWFPKPEIAMLCSIFAENEGRHAKSYNLINEKLGLEEYDAFLEEPAVAERLSNLMTVKHNTPQEMAVSLAVFSFCEGVSLFSAFATLLHFKNVGKLKGTCKLIEWSTKDESAHAYAGSWLFNQLLKEYPEIDTEQTKEAVYEGIRHIMQLEEDYIDYIFRDGDIPGLSQDDLKAYVRMRANTKLADIGYDPIFDYDKEASNRIAESFAFMTTATVQTDFFHNAEANYNKQTLDVNELDFD